MDEESYNCEVCLDDKSFIGCYVCGDEEYEDEEMTHSNKHDDVSFPIENSDCTYYGKMSNDQPDSGVVYYMLDEHLKKVIDKRANQFVKVLETTLKRFKQDNKDEMVATRKSLAFSRVQIRRLEKRNSKFEKDIAELKISKIEPKSKGKK